MHEKNHFAQVDFWYCFVNKLWAKLYSQFLGVFLVQLVQKTDDNIENLTEVKPQGGSKFSCKNGGSP